MEGHLYPRLQAIRDEFQSFGIQPLKPVLYRLLILSLSIWLMARIYKRFSSHPTPNARKLDLEKPTVRDSIELKGNGRPLGLWNPVSFHPPPPEPFPNWDIHTTLPLPYRPFRHGPYHITMGLRTMKWDEWIELDNHYLKFHADKARRIKERGSKCCKTAPEAFDGAVELLEEL